MTTCYELITIMAPGLVRLKSRHGTQIFSERKLRKPRECEKCGALVPTGGRAFGDVTSCSMNRADRVCGDCVDKMMVEFGKPSGTELASGPCAYPGCDATCSKDAYCHGCKFFVCEAHSTNIDLPWGGHHVAQHWDETENDDA